MKLIRCDNCKIIYSIDEPGMIYNGETNSDACCQECMDEYLEGLRKTEYKDE